MKRTQRRLLNIFSIALLLFALYLNFLKKEPVEISTIDNTATTPDSKEVKSISVKPEHPLVLK